MDGTNSISVRPFADDDAAEALALMRELATFEGYIDKFVPDEADLRQYGSGKDQRFQAFVAVDDNTDRLVGIAVVYTIPWTYDLQPTVVLKELFVAAGYRRAGVGRRLMVGVAEHAVALGASRLQWTVLADNARAQAFYRELGGETDRVWQHWEMTEHELAVLAKQASSP
ncbi:MAG: GNAT family N-acetyltransferase [Pseudomonadota bacterium]